MAEHPNSPRCHHVRTNGLRCGSPAMRNNKHCYYHRQTLGSPRNPRRAELTNLEDGNAIQLAIAHLDRQIDMGTIEYRAAHIKADLYRLALRNLKNMNPDPCNQKDVVTFDPALDDANTSTAEPIPAEPITTEPLTYDQELDLIEEGTLTAREASTKDAQQPRSGDTRLALAAGERGASAVPPTQSARAESLATEPWNKRPGEAIDHDPSPTGATPLESPKDDIYLAQHVSGGDEMKKNPSPVGTAQGRETGNHQRPFEDLSDKEQEEMIMRLSKNDAYFLPEDTSKQPPESAADFGELVAILRRELAG